MQLNPYEKKNLIFIDTEFTDLEPVNGEILSIGMVKLNGEELYLEIAHTGPMTDWVAKHIAPNLKDLKLTVTQAVDKIHEFLGESQPFAVAFVDNYDVIYLTKMFGAGKLPFNWMTVDFTSILFANGIDPKKVLRDSKDSKSFYRTLGLDLKKYRKHHALDDARLLRDVWLKITSDTIQEEMTNE